MRRVAFFGALLLLLAAAGGATTVYKAFGDSITAGDFDDPTLSKPGYPPRLKKLLKKAGLDVAVENHGLSGELTTGGVTRIDSILSGGDVLLLMEGTNDINGELSTETTLTNLSIMAAKAAAQGLTTIYATLIPRLPFANRDSDNTLTAARAVGIRQLAHDEGRQLADPFEVFGSTPDVFNTLYAPEEDRVGHPNASGYDVLAQIFADVILGVDTVPPVRGAVSPASGDTQVDPQPTIQVELFDFLTGVDGANTVLLLNDQEVPAKQFGDETLTILQYVPDEPLIGFFRLAVRAQDLADPANTTEFEASQFIIAGTKFLQGDLNLDGRVDGVDLVELGRHFGLAAGDPGFDATSDLTGDGLVDGEDLAVLAASFGKSSF